MRNQRMSELEGPVELIYAKHIILQSQFHSVRTYCQHWAAYWDPNMEKCRLEKTLPYPRSR